MKKTLFFVSFLFISIQFNADSASAKSADETKAIKYVMEYMTNEEGYRELDKKKNFYYYKNKNGDISVEYRDKNGRYPSFFSFKNKYKFNRLYKLDLMQGKTVVVRYYSIKGKKGSKALKSTTALKELKTIKKLGNKKKTVATKSLTVGTSYKNIQKKLGKPKKKYVPMKNVVYVYPKSKIAISSDFNYKKSTWVPFKNSKVTGITIQKAKNKAFTYKDIKKVFGEKHFYASYSHVYGYQTLHYSFKNYSIIFYSKIYENNNAKILLGLSDTVLFDHYEISAPLK